MSPEAAVRAWWQAMQDRDTATLTEITLPDYMGSGGPGGRTAGRGQLLAEAGEFFAVAEIKDWSITDLEVRRHGPTAVCAYLWAETGSHGGAAFELAGQATDVLVWQDGRWRHQAHHVSLGTA